MKITSSDVVKLCDRSTSIKITSSDVVKLCVLEVLLSR